MGKAISAGEPRLIILKKIEGIPTRGGCSSCAGTIFASGAIPIGDVHENLGRLQKAFRRHFETVHLHKDSGQAADGAQ